MITRILYLNYRASSGIKFLFKRRFTPVGVLVLAAAFLTGGIGIDTNQAIAYQAFALLGCLLLFSVLWTIFPARKFQGQRILPRIGTAGQPLKYRVQVTNPGRGTQSSVLVSEDLGDPRPTYAEFANNPEPGERRRNPFDRLFRFYRWMWLIERKQIAEIFPGELPPMRPGGTVEASIEILPKRRGQLQLQGLLFTVPDPFGLCRSYSRTKLPGKVLIFPKRYHVPRLLRGAALQYHPGGVSLASSLGESEEFMSVREYRRGDPLRHIHWKSTSKTGKLIVKEFQNEFFSRHALVLDTFLRDTNSNPLFEEAVSVAASFAYSLNNDDSLLDLLFVGTEAFCVTTGHGVAQVDHMLEILATVQPCTNAAFADLQDLVVRQLGLVSACVCIFLEWDRQRKELVEQIALLSLPVLVFVIIGKGRTPPEPNLKPVGTVQFRVLELGKIQEQLATLEP